MKNKTKMPEYRVWREMKQRCYCKTNKAYPNYGGRGIFICDRWLGENGFKNFIDDVGLKPTPKHTIDRFPNNDGNYERENCRWATRKEQIENRRNSICFMVDGKVATIQSIANTHNVRYQTIMRRVKLGWSVDDIIKTPVKHFVSDETIRQIVEYPFGIKKTAKQFGISDSEVSYIRIRERKKAK